MALWLRATFVHLRRALAGRASELELQAARFRGILENMTASVAVKDLDGRYVLANDVWRSATGMEGADVIGHTDAELFAPEISEPTAVSDARVRAGERSSTSAWCPAGRPISS